MEEFHFVAVPCVLLLRPTSDPGPSDVFQVPRPGSEPGRILLQFSDHDLAQRCLRSLGAEEAMRVGQFATAEKFVALLTASRDEGTTHVGTDFSGQPGSIATTGIDEAISKIWEALADTSDS